MYSRQTDHFIVVYILLAPPPSPKTFGVITCKLCSLLAKSPVIVTCVAYPSPLCLSTTNTHQFHVPSPFVPLPDLL